MEKVLHYAEWPGSMHDESKSYALRFVDSRILENSQFIGLDFVIFVVAHHDHEAGARLQDSLMELTLIRRSFVIWEGSADLAVLLLLVHRHVCEDAERRTAAGFIVN
jgi:hypothetical protein